MLDGNDCQALMVAGMRQARECERAVDNTSF